MLHSETHLCTNCFIILAYRVIKKLIEKFTYMNKVKLHKCVKKDVTLWNHSKILQLYKWECKYLTGCPATSRVPLFSDHLSHKSVISCSFVGHALQKEHHVGQGLRKERNAWVWCLHSRWKDPTYNLIYKFYWNISCYLKNYYTIILRDYFEHNNIFTQTYSILQNQNEYLLRCFPDILPPLEATSNSWLLSSVQFTSNLLKTYFTLLQLISVIQLIRLVAAWF